MALLTFEPKLSWHFALDAESLFLNSAICAVFPVFDARSLWQDNKGSGLREFQHKWVAPTGCTDNIAAVRSHHSNEKRPIRRRSHPRLTNLAKGFDAAVRQNDFTSSMTRRPSRFPLSPPRKTVRSDLCASRRALRDSGSRPLFKNLSAAHQTGTPSWHQGPALGCNPKSSSAICRWLKNTCIRTFPCTGQNSNLKELI